MYLARYFRNFIAFIIIKIPKNNIDMMFTPEILPANQ